VLSTAGSCLFQNLPANKKAARSGGCSDVCFNIQIERDPPAASELS